MADDLVALMAGLGHDRFAVVGHDRGARAAFRMALDHPQRVTRVALLNIVPTVDQFERMAAEAALDYFPWYVLAQPPPFSERLIAASAEEVVRHLLTSWVAVPDAITADAAERYVAAFTPEAIAAICAEFRAAFHLDRPLDAADREAGRRIGCPVLVHWGDEEGSVADGPLRVWERWADDVEGGPLPSGHFVPEEAADALSVSLRGFLTAG
jgi:haloacetate dehalogenase